MSAPRVIQATFHDWRTVKGRKMLQLVLEVPMEDQTKVLTMLGPPEPSGSKWVAVALLDMKAAQARKDSEKTERSLAERCAILCTDARFRDYLTKTWGLKITDASMADDIIKKRLGIASKKELNEKDPTFNAEAAANFKLLVMTYESTQADQEFAHAHRT